MPNIYCPQCGSSTKYLYEKPNFCSSCVEPFSKRVIAKKTSFKELDDLEDENDTLEEYTPKKQRNIIGKAQIVVENEQVSKLVDIMGTTTENEKVKRTSRSHKDYFNQIKTKQNHSID